MNSNNLWIVLPDMHRRVQDISSGGAQISFCGAWGDPPRKIFEKLLLKNMF